jgi:hypothetical protein
MAFDQGPPIQAVPGPNWTMPEITDVKIRAAAYEPRASRNFKNPVEAVREAVEVVVTVKSPIPARAMAPVLYVGSTRLTESEQVDKEGRQVRFWAFDQAQLKSGAGIALAWSGEAPPKESKKAKFTYRPPK